MSLVVCDFPLIPLCIILFLYTLFWLFELTNLVIHNLKNLHGLCCGSRVLFLQKQRASDMRRRDRRFGESGWAGDASYVGYDIIRNISFLR